jgi:phytoene dehydrogenase-like protein
MHDAIVIGSGPNGLVGANQLADEGWDVLVLEASAEPGGAVKSTELIEPGYINDHCASFFPLGAASPAIESMGLEEYGLKWLRSPLVVAHASLDGNSAYIAPTADETAEGLGADGDAWLKLHGLWSRQSKNILSALFTPFPPVRAGAKMAWSLRGRDLVRFARMGVLPVRTMGEERFSGEPARRLLAGLALHADLLPESALSGFYGWLMGALGQQFGFPVPEGGAGRLSAAMVTRLKAHGGKVVCNKRVTKIIVRKNRAVAVQCEDGSEYEVRRAVLADVDAPSLYTRLLPADSVPQDQMEDINNFQWDTSTVKVDWNLDGPIQWTNAPARRSGTVHVGEGVDALSTTASQLARGVIPDKPFLLLGQHSMTDASRSPQGKETAWAYTHVPRRVKADAGGNLTGAWSQAEADSFVDRMEDEIEARAPGFKALIRGRYVMTPNDLESENSNLVGGAVGGGTAQLHQQLVFRPIPGWGRPETPVKGLYLASSSAHPGGGVHGACGANAARAALFHWRLRRFR